MRGPCQAPFGVSPIPKAQRWHSNDPAAESSFTHTTGQLRPIDLSGPAIPLRSSKPSGPTPSRQRDPECLRSGSEPVRPHPNSRRKAGMSSGSNQDLIWHQSRASTSRPFPTSKSEKAHSRRPRSLSAASTSSCRDRLALGRRRDRLHKGVSNPPRDRDDRTVVERSRSRHTGPAMVANTFRVRANGA
jgi:hypothetical protein